jgi:hypothetical protein
MHCNHHVCPFSIQTKISIRAFNVSNHLTSLLMLQMSQAYCGFTSIEKFTKMQTFCTSALHTYSSHQQDSQVLCTLFSHFLHLEPKQPPEVNTMFATAAC